jgi:iron only hydrogenase large subunit-like protein
MMTGQEMSTLKINELRGMKGLKEARIKIGKTSFKAASVSGLANARALIDDLEAGRQDFSIIEVMACPNGCINGGGQRLNPDEKSMKSRMKALYDVDDEEMIRVAHKNPVIIDLYERFLAKPFSDRNKELLHVNRPVKEGS